MNKVEFDTLPQGTLPTNPEQLMRMARDYRTMETQAYKSISGADVAEAPINGLVADALGTIASGKDLEATLTLLRGKWSRYVQEQQERVNKAPKLKLGPMAGNSVIHHRWVSMSLWEYKEHFIRSVVQF